MSLIRQGLSLIHKNIAFSSKLIAIYAGLSAAALFLAYPWWVAFSHEPVVDYENIVYFHVKGNLSYESLKYYASRQQSFSLLTRVKPGRITLDSGSDIDTVEVDPDFFSIFPKANTELGRVFSNSDNGDIVTNSIVVTRQLLDSIHDLKEATDRKEELFLETYPRNLKIIGVVDNFKFPVNSSAWMLISDQMLRQSGGLNISFIGLLHQDVSLKEAQSEFDKIVSEFNGENQEDFSPTRFQKFSEYSRRGFEIDLLIISSLLICLLVSGVSSVCGSIFAELLKQDKGWKIRHFLGITPTKIIIAPSVFVVILLIVGALLGMVIYSSSYPFIEKYQIIKNEAAPFWWRFSPSALKNTKFLFVLVFFTALCILTILYLHLRLRSVSRGMKKISRNKSVWFDRGYWLLLGVQNIITLWIAFYILMLCFAYYQETRSYRGFISENISTISLRKELTITKQEILLKVESALGLRSTDFCVVGEIPSDSNYSTYSMFHVNHRPSNTNPLALMEVSVTFFDILGIGLVAGRYFNNLDMYDSGNVIIIDQSTAKIYGGDTEAIGQTVTLYPESRYYRRDYTIVGVTRNIIGNPLGTATAYIPLGHGISSPGRMKIIYRSSATDGVLNKINSYQDIFHHHDLLDNIVKKSGDPYLKRILNFLPSAILILIMLILCIKVIASRILLFKSKDIAIMLSLGIGKPSIFQRIMKNYLITISLSSTCALIFISQSGVTKWMIYITNTQEIKIQLMALILFIFFIIETYFFSIPIFKKLEAQISKLLKTDT